MANTTTQQVIKAIDAAIAGGEKATAVFKEFVGFPSAKPTAMEAQYQLVLDAVAVPKGEKNAAVKAKAVRRNGALRALMAWVRSNCDAPYAKGKDGKLTAKAPKAKGPKAKGETKAPKADGMTDALALARVAQLGNAFLTAEDKPIMARLIAAISHKLQGATKGKAKA